MSTTQTSPNVPRDVIHLVHQQLAAYPELTIYHDPDVEPGNPGRFCPPPDTGLHARLLEYLERRYSRGLFSHQREAVQRVLAGQNTVVATRTSSGKSLIYALPVFDALCRDSSATSLFLYPQKALANDQLIKLREMAAEIEPLRRLLAAKRRLISRYDGSTPEENRPDVRREVQVLLTNPDMLHLGILQHHDHLWKRFFANLRYVAIDECHEYRGIFGTNVAYVLHRLRQVCARYGQSPRFVATSATVQEPKAHLERLTGVEFTSIDAPFDGSLQGRRKFWMVDAKEHYYETGRKLALALADAGLTVLAFCPSRVCAERMVARLPKSERGENSQVRVYRAGLSPQEREEIEQGLRDRSVRVVFSTSALELGIDIGEIDVVLCIGLPNSMMSLWQRAGRTARAGREGAAILIPADTPIDTYYAAHPEEFFSRDHEPLVLNLSNRRIVCQHYACAVQEADGDESQLNREALGREIACVHQLRAEGKLNREEFYRSDPHIEINIRGAGAGVFSLVHGDEKIGEIDTFHLLREAYRNAIYRHGGKTFRVQDVIRGRRVVRLQREFTRNETCPYIQKKVRLKRQYATADYSTMRVATVAVDVTEYLVAVSEKDPTGAAVRTWQGGLGMPAHQLPTEGTMLLFKPDFWSRRSEELPPTTIDGLRSSERLLCSLFPTIAGPCDTNDFSSTIDRLPTGEWAIFLYDLVYDGVDLTKGAFELIDALVARSIERIDTCDCPGDTGCFRCIANPLADEPTSKLATRSILEAIQRVLQHETPSVSRTDEDLADSLQADSAVKCPTCGTAMPAGARFCPNCGNKVE